MVDSTVKLRDVESGAERICTIVEPPDLFLVRGAISVFDPLGNSLLGRAVGDIVECWELTRHRRVQIAAILFKDGMPPIETEIKKERFESGSHSRFATDPLK
jgi:transcription elongation GreA/GreB family factor